jgi:hypothetical protein
MKHTINLQKMETENSGPISYFMNSQGSRIFINELIGKEMSICFKKEINCIKCGSITKTSFSQGYCYSCFISSPETEDCVLRPELCLAHLGKARDMEYAKTHCLIDHFVYLALSGGLKVGVTRNTQIPVRWIDQGATKAIILAKTPNRFLAGSIEVALKKHYHDKTNWRKMLSSENYSEFDLRKEKNVAFQFLHADFQKFRYEDDSITELYFPVSEFPPKIKSIGFDKVTEITGILDGIKGQYLIFRSGEVLNIRKHGGYLVEISY